MADLFDSRSLDVLKYAQRMRQELLTNVIGDKLPDADDLKTAGFVLNALRDMETVEINVAKVRASQQQADAQTANAAIMAQIMRNLGNAPVPANYNTSYELPEELEADLIDGEADIDYQAISYDALLAAAQEEEESFSPDAE